MSLNHFTNKLNGTTNNFKIGCSQFECTEDCIIKGNIIPSNITTPNFVLANVDGNGNLQFVPQDTGPQGDVTYTGVNPMPQIGQIAIYSAVNGEGIEDSNLLLSDLVNDVNTNTTNNAGPVIIHSDVSSAGSGQIITNGERNQIGTNNVNNTGTVTIHSDVTSAGSGQIITAGERTQITTNQTNISTNSGNIASNTVEIDQNKINIANNTASINTNTVDIGLNTTNITNLQNDKVNKAGDSMTGNLNMQSHDILGVDNIVLSTINGSSYPPVGIGDVQYDGILPATINNLAITTSTDGLKIGQAQFIKIENENLNLVNRNILNGGAVFTNRLNPTIPLQFIADGGNVGVSCRASIQDGRHIYSDAVIPANAKGTVDAIDINADQITKNSAVIYRFYIFNCEVRFVHNAVVAPPFYSLRCPNSIDLIISPPSSDPTREVLAIFNPQTLVWYIQPSA